MQAIDTWISNRLSKLQDSGFQNFQEEIERQSLFIIGDDRASRKQSLIMAKAICYLKKSSLEGGHHDMAMKAPEEMLFDFKITHSNNHRRRLQESIKALGSFNNSENSSEHMPLKENSQDGVLHSTCPRRKIAKMNDC